MIRNILFDMGNVLLRFDRELFLNRLALPEADKRLLDREVFRSVDWARMDRGSLDEAGAVARMCERLPERLWDAARTLVLAWDRPILPVEGMCGLLEELKAAGYRLYLLSNASVRQEEYWSRVPGNELFDGCVISAREGLVKPQPEIYRLVLARFALRAEECFFIDDVAANVEGALVCGIPGAVFHGDIARLREDLRAAGVLTHTPQTAAL